MGGNYCACGKCGLRVLHKGHSCGDEESEKKFQYTKGEDKLEVGNARAVEDDSFPALTEKQRKDATSQAILIYDEKFLQFRKQNKGKGVIIVSIVVTAEGLHPSGRIAGHSIVKELERASLCSHGMANLVQLVTCKGVTYYVNPTVEEQKRLGASGELLFNAEGNHQLAMHVEKVMQVYTLHRERLPSSRTSSFYS